MSAVELVPAEEAHIAPIAENMRIMDRWEAAAFGHSPEQALWLGLKASVDCMTAMVDGEPVAMLGLVPKNIIEGEGQPWMLGTDAIYDNPRATLVLSRRMVERWRFTLPNLSNYVAAKNDRAIRFIRRLGFRIEGERRVIGGLEFVTFTRDRENV
jgi:hypothetical protein